MLLKITLKRLGLAAVGLVVSSCAGVSYKEPTGAGNATIKRSAKAAKGATQGVNVRLEMIDNTPLMDNKELWVGTMFSSDSLKIAPGSHLMTVNIEFWRGSAFLGTRFIGRGDVIAKIEGGKSYQFTGNLNGATVDVVLCETESGKAVSQVSKISYQQFIPPAYTPIFIPAS